MRTSFTLYRRAIMALPLFLAVALSSGMSHFVEAAPPNVLLIVSEDNGPELGCYGDPHARTPNLDKLASGGVRFNHAKVGGFIHYLQTAPAARQPRTKNEEPRTKNQEPGTFI